MSYADKRLVLNHKVGASISDNTDINFIKVPAGKQVKIFGMTSFTITKSPTANAKIELVDSSNNIVASVSITQNNGTIAEASQTMPVTFLNSSASDSFLKLRTDQATGVGCDVAIAVDMEHPGQA